MRRLVAYVGLGATTAATVLLGLPGAAWAADGDIDNVSSDDKTVQVVFSLPGLAAGTTPDLEHGRGHRRRHHRAGHRASGE